jgi:hypothetical protein
VSFDAGYASSFDVDTTAPGPTPDERQAAEDVVRAYCGWVIAPSTDEDFTLDGELAVIQPIPTLYMTALRTLTICDQVIDVTDHSQVEWSQSGFLRRAAGFGGQLRGVQVAITHGYPDWPFDVLAVVDGLIARGADVGSSTLVQVGQVRQATGADGLPYGEGVLTGYEQTVLDRYRLPLRP